MISYESQYYGVVPFLSEYLMHYQVKGAKHGVRRWQNYDGSLTPAGYIHYGVGQGRNKAKTDTKGGRDAEFKADSALRHKMVKRMDDMVHQGADIAEAIDEVSRKTGISYDALDAEYRRSGKYHSDPKTGEMEPKPGSGALPQKVMPGDDYFVRKGTSGQRFTTQKNEEIGDERKYLTYTEKDKQIYRDFYPSALSRRRWDEMYDLPDRVYETKLTAIKDLRVAGSKTYQNTFMELYNDKATREQAGWATSVGYERMQKILGTKVADLTFGKKREEAISKSRDLFDKNLQKRNNEINNKFLSKLKAKGYDAIEDQFSKAVDGTQGPLIILNPKESVKGRTVGEVVYKDGKNKTISIAAGNKEFDKLKAEIDKDRKLIANEYAKLEKKYPDKKPYEISEMVADKVHGDQVAVESVILEDVIRKRKQKGA